MSKKKHNRKAAEKIAFLEEALINNGKAMIEGPTKRKKWTIHDMISIKPLSEKQEDVFHSFNNDRNMIVYGSAGTGKTFLICYLAMACILSKNCSQDKLIIIRSAVPARDIGFMPGDLEEKMSYYEQPYRDVFASIFERSSTYDDMKDAGLIQFMPTSYLRGLTWDRAFILVDECQNMTFEEINTVATRVGNYSRIIFTGDSAQNDLVMKKREQSGMNKLLEIASMMESEFDMIEFTHKDIIRSDFVKRWIVAKDKYEVFN